MTYLSLGKPITIGGEEVVVVRDVIGSLQSDRAAETFSILEGRGSDGRPPIYVSETDLNRLRDDYPGIKVYGLWQLMFHNGLVRFGAPLITFPLSETGGLYLLLDPASDYSQPSHLISSGEFLNGYIPENSDIDVADASKISVDVRTLRLPASPAYTRLEQSQKFKSENKRRWMVVGSLCALIGVGALATNYGMHTLHKSQMADYHTKKSQIIELEDRIAALAAERLLVRPDDSIAIDQLLTLYLAYPDMQTPTSTEELRLGFTGEHLLITPRNAPVDPALIVPGAITELQPDLSYRVLLTPPPEQDSDRHYEPDAVQVPDLGLEIEPAFGLESEPTSPDDELAGLFDE